MTKKRSLLLSENLMRRKMKRWETLGRKLTRSDYSSFIQCEHNTFVPLPFPDTSSRAPSVNIASTLVISSDPVFIVPVGFWLNILHSFAWNHSQAGSTWRANRAGRPGGESRLRQRVEGEPQWTQWRSKVMSFISLRANLANKCLIIKNKLNK